MLVFLNSQIAFGAMVQTGDAAPIFTAVDTKGVSVDLEALRGKKVILEWTNHKCPFVVKHYNSGNMQALQREAADAGITWITVVSSAKGKQGHVGAEKANELTKKRGAAPTHVVLDPSGEIGSLFKATSTPHMFVIDEAGILVYAGAIDSIPSARKRDIVKAQNYVRTALADLDAGKPVQMASTAAYGCSIKY